MRTPGIKSKAPARAHVVLVSWLSLLSPFCSARVGVVSHALVEMHIGPAALAARGAIAAGIKQSRLEWRSRRDKFLSLLGPGADVWPLSLASHHLSRLKLVKCGRACAASDSYLSISVLICFLFSFEPLHTADACGCAWTLCTTRKDETRTCRTRPQQARTRRRMLPLRDFPHFQR